MDYCLGNDDGTADIWTGVPDVDVDGDGEFDWLSTDFDGDGLRDDVFVDLDGDDMAEHLLLDGVGPTPSWFTDDGTGTWLVPAEPGGGELRWFGVGGAEQTGGPMVDFDGDGVVDDLLVDSDADGLADRALCSDGLDPAAPQYRVGYVDVDGDGTWDVKLVDNNGDNAADDAVGL